MEEEYRVIKEEYSNDGNGNIVCDVYLVQLLPLNDIKIEFVVETINN